MTESATVTSRKLVLLGESAVGKSSIALRFAKNNFDDYRESTIGAAFLTRVLGNIKFEIWDTAGQERYASLAPMYYRGAHSAIVVYDITSSASLIKAKSWIQQLQRQADSSIVIALAGNKSDLSETQRQVTQEEAQKYAQEEGLLSFECSAKTGQSVEHIFQAVADKLIVEAPTPTTARLPPRGSVNLAANPNGQSDSQCAC